MEKIEQELEKNRHYYRMMNIWFSQIQRGKSLIPYMKKKGYSTVAIYGMAELGERLYYELIHGGVAVKCVIDRSPFVMGEFDLISPEKEIPDVDAVIVTAEYYFDEIEKQLKVKKGTPIVPLSALVGNAFGLNW